MKRTFVVLGLLAAFCLFCAAQPQSSLGSNSSAVQITNGPGVDNITPTSAEVFWNTNAPSAAIVRYGTDEDKLTQTARATAGQTDHKVQLSNLQPGTTYFFQVETVQATSSAGNLGKSGIGTFKTKSKGGDDQKY